MLLALPDVTIIDKEELAGDIRIVVETTNHPKTCQRCMDLTAKISRFGTRPRSYMDLPIRTKRVGLLVRQKRFKCYNCGQTFIEHLGFVDEKRSMTKRLVEYVEKQAASKRSFASIAAETGLLEKTVRDILEDFHIRVISKMKFETPEVLGLDELHILGKARAVITNTKENTIIEMLEDANKKTVADFLRTLNPTKVKCINTDMCLRYRDAINEVMPDVDVVSDKAHVLFKVGLAVDAFRIAYVKSLEKGERTGLKKIRSVMRQRNHKLSDKAMLALEAWHKNHNLVWKAYAAKEDFYAIYDAKDKDDAEGRFDRWAGGLSEELLPYFGGLIDTISRWRKEVFAYFIHRTTNAAAESLNARIRDIDIAGKGLSFKVLRMKVLYTEGRHKIITPKYDKSAFSIHRWVVGMDRPRNYGVSISTFLSLLDGGQI